MIRKIFALASVPVAVALVALGATGAANASVKPDTVLNGVNVTTNNGVSGYYTDNPAGNDWNLQWNQDVVQADENMTAGSDGIGGQLSNPDSGQTFGAGIERLGTSNTFGVFYAYGFLNGDPGAIFNQGLNAFPDSNKALGGILPSVNPLSLSDVVHVGDTVHFWLRMVHAQTGQHRWWVKVSATDTNQGDTHTGSIRLPKGVRPNFTQAGIGVQRSLTGLTSPANAAILDQAWGISITSTFASGFNAFGCALTTTEVNSSATTNGDNGVEPNSSAQLDPENSLSNGCGFVTPIGGHYASLKVYEGNQVS